MATLFDHCNPPSIQQAFDRFDEENPKIYRLFVEFAHKARAAGLTRYSADAILHRIRWHLTVDVHTAGDGFRINNNHASRYARKLISEDDSFSEFFQTRKLLS